MIFDLFYLPLCLYCVQITDSFEISEDIVQEFLTSFWEKKRLESINSCLRNYLFLSVRNAALREIKRRNMTSLETLANIPIVMEELFESEEEIATKEAMLKRELEQLSSNEYKAVQGVVIENRKYAEVAASMNISVNTLKTYLSRAFKKLRKSDLLLFLIFHI